MANKNKDSNLDNETKKENGKKTKNSSKASIKNMTSKSTKKNSKNGKEANTNNKESTEKKPLVSTKRKVGLAVYFTFLATLALTFGAQIWMMDIFNTPATKETNASEQTTEDPLPSIQSEPATPTIQEQSEVVTYQEETAPQQENLDDVNVDNYQNYQFETPDNQVYPNIVLQ